MRRAPSLVLLATGVMVAVVVVVGCRPADETGLAVVVDAGAAPVVVVDAGTIAVALLVDAGSAEVPTVATLVDAGTMADPPADPPAIPATEPAPSTGSPIFNRLLVQPKETSEGQDVLQRRIEKTLGQKVKSLRRTAGTFWLVQLVPVTPPRTRLDQARAIERLQKSGAFKSVEGDQLMTIKTGLKLR